MAVEFPAVDDVFFRAIRLVPGEKRSEYLDSACGDNPELRQRVERLLQAHSEAGSFLEYPAGDPLPTIDQPITEKPGTVIGPYKLLQKIGEGGMGVVYMAEQTEPLERRVALKIIKPGMDTRQVIARFEAERQALAMMDHPNIAKVLDAGATESGRPHFVMELVKGAPVTAYCDQQHLTPKQRLELFVPICHAVQHAHQKGLIHRDLKPSNILVARYDDKAVPKVIDFGVAKATAQRLTEKTLFTQYGQIVGTLEYMSPEQAQLNQLDIDTRSDIYSLGVLLYELLTGTTPFDRKRLQSAAFEEMLRIIRDEEPPRPSTRLSTIDTLPAVAANRHVEPQRLSALVRGDLDWIVMKALEKDRGRRYETANGLATDIEHYLNDEPVQACPPSAAYKFRKFARRNKPALATVVMVASALLFGMIGTTWQAVRATHAEGEAKSERDIAKTQRIEADEAREHAVQAQRAERAQKKHVTRLLASSYVDRAQALCEQGEIGRGMLWFAHSLRTAPDDPTDLQQLIRTNLAAWSRRLHSLTMLVQHESEVVAIAFSPDGLQFLTGTTEGRLHLWDAATGRHIRESAICQEAWELVDPMKLNPHQRRFLGAVFSPDGSRILTASNERTAHLWDATTLEPIGEPLQHTSETEAIDSASRVRLVGFSPDGSRIATASGWGQGRVRLWAADTLEPIGEPFEQGDPLAVAFCPGGLRVLASCPVPPYTDRLQLWNLDSGEAIGSVIETDVIFSATIGPDGSVVAAAFADGGRIKIWNAATGKATIEPIVHGGVVRTMAFSPDGSQLLSGGNTRASMLWDTETGKPIGTPMRQLNTAYVASFNADGTQVAVGGQDGSVRLWNVAQVGSSGRTIEHDEPVMTAGYSANGLRILTGKDRSLQLRDAATGEAIGKPYGYRRQAGWLGMDFSPDGSRVLVRGRGFAEVRDVASGEILGALSPSNIHEVAFSPNGSRILAGLSGDRSYLWDAATLARLGDGFQHDGTVMAVAFVQDGARLLTGSLDGTTRAWDGATFGPIGEPVIHHSEVKAFACSPDDERMVVGYADGTVRMWNLADMVPIGVPLHHQNLVSSVTFCPHGSRFLTCSLDGTAQVWDTATRKRIGPILRHNAWWPRGLFSPDGQEFVVVSESLTSAESGNAQVWATPPGPFEGSVDQLVLWTEVITGLELDENEGIGAVDGPAWQKRVASLQEFGGPPTPSFPSPRTRRIETDFSRSMDLAVLGRDRAMQGQWEEAMADFAEAFRLSGGSPTLRLQVACWLNQLADDWRDVDSHAAAEEASHQTVTLLEELVNGFSDETTYRNRLALQYFKISQALREMGAVEEAKEIEGRLVALFPGDWQSRMASAGRQVPRGGNLTRIGQPLAAQKPLAAALPLLLSVLVEIRDEPRHRHDLAKCYRSLARVFSLTGQVQEALEAYYQAIEVLPKHPWAYSYAAEYLLTLRNTDAADPAEALRLARKADELHPDYGRFLSVLGRANYRAGNLADAIESLRKPASAPQESAAEYKCAADRFYLAMAHWQLGQPQEARQWYRQAVELAKNHPTDEKLRRVHEEATELLGDVPEQEEAEPSTIKSDEEPEDEKVEDDTSSDEPSSP